MNIKGWHIDGFGVFCDFRVDEIPSGLTVFQGPNEAGKTTLFTFLRMMLFGGGRSRSNAANYSPLRGGQHGGTLFLHDQGETRYRVYRELTRNGAFHLWRDEQPAEITVLNRLLGGCDERMFSAVFTFGLAELQKLEAMEQEEIKGRLALVGLSGAGQSPHEVLKNLASEKSNLMRPRSSQGRINGLRDRVVLLNNELQRARGAAANYEQARDREREATKHSEKITREIVQLRGEHERYRRLIDLWPTLCQQRDAMRDRAEIALDDSLAAIGEEVMSMERDIGRYDDWLARLSDHLSKQQSAEAAVTARIRDLGPGWDAARLLAFDRSIPRQEEIRELQERLDASRDALRKAEDVRSASHEHAGRSARAREQADEVRHAVAEPETEEALEHQGASLRRLRANFAIATNLEGEVRRDQEQINGLGRLQQSANATRPTGTINTTVISLWTLAAVAVGIAIWVWTAGNLILSTAMAALAVIAFVAGLRAQRRNAAAAFAQAHVGDVFTEQLASVGARLDANQIRLLTLTQDIATDARLVGAPESPSSLDIEDADHRLNQRREHRRTVMHLQEQLDNALALERESLAARTAADEEFQAAAKAAHDIEVEWSTWLAAAELPEHLSPQSTIDYFNVLEKARDDALFAQSAKRDASDVDHDLSEFEQRLTLVVTQIGEAPVERGKPTIDTVELLKVLVEGDCAARQKYAELERKAQDAMRRITEVLGSGEEADRSRALLESGTIDEWHAKLNETQNQVEELEAQKEAAVGAAKAAEIDRMHLEESADIARLELELNGLKTEAAEAIRAWSVLALAEGLIQTTLAKFEQERQPAVLQHASTLFSRVTNGRYARLSRSVESTGRNDGDLLISGVTGQPLTADRLSRGTMEQLYLCLRLGLAHSLTKETGLLPLIMDDVLVNFDPERARAVAAMLCQIAEERQVILFTCHPDTVAMLREVNDRCGHFVMERHGTGGSWQVAA